MGGKNSDLVTRINSPTLKTFFQNLLADIPADFNLTEVTSEIVAPLDKSLSLIQQVRTEESGQVVTELESIIHQIHVVSGEYSPQSS
jgi:hypothetical protein